MKQIDDIIALGFTESYETTFSYFAQNLMEEFPTYLSAIGLDVDAFNVFDSITTYPDMCLPAVGEPGAITPMFYLLPDVPLFDDYVIDELRSQFYYQESAIMSVFLASFPRLDALLSRLNQTRLRNYDGGRDITYKDVIRFMLGSMGYGFKGMKTKFNDVRFNKLLDDVIYELENSGRIKRTGATDSHIEKVYAVFEEAKELYDKFNRDLGPFNEAENVETRNKIIEAAMEEFKQHPYTDYLKYGYSDRKCGAFGVATLLGLVSAAQVLFDLSLFLSTAVYINEQESNEVEDRAAKEEGINPYGRGALLHDLDTFKEILKDEEDLIEDFIRDYKNTGSFDMKILTRISNAVMDQFYYESYEKDNTLEVTRFHSHIARQLAQDFQNFYATCSLFANGEGSTPSGCIQASVKQFITMYGLETPETILRRRSLFNKVVKQAAKDMRAYINRSYPTFRIYVINPSNLRIYNFDEFYDINAVESIDIYRDKSGVNDTARIVISDQLQSLTLDSDYRIEEININGIPNTYSDLTLRTGMKILIYLGYSNNEKHLGQRFVGTITDIVPNNGRIEIVAGGFGQEALVKGGSKLSSNKKGEEGEGGAYEINIGSTKLFTTHGDIFAYIVHNSLSMPNLGSKYYQLDLHYHSGLGLLGYYAGFLSGLLELLTPKLRSLYHLLSGSLGGVLENVYLPISYMPYSSDNKLKNYFKKYARLTSETSRSLDNLVYAIFGPPKTKLEEYAMESAKYNIVDIILGREPPKPPNKSEINEPPENKSPDSKGAFGLEYKAVDRTIYDILSEISDFYLNYIVTVLPYNNGLRSRATLYSGKKNGLYKRYDDLVRRYYDGILINNFFKIYYNTDPLETVYGLSIDDEHIRDTYFRALLLPPNLPIDIYHWLNEIHPYFVHNLTTFSPLQKYHFITSGKDILKNGIVASDTDMHNTISYHFTDEVIEWTPGLVVPDENKFKNNFLVMADDSIPDDKLIVYDYFAPNTDPNWLLDLATNLYIKREIKKSLKDNSHVDLISLLPWYMIPPFNALSRELSKMYSGDLVIVGHPNIDPWDIVYIHDTVNDMHGFIEVEAVMDHFSYETGYVTIIQPAALTYTADLSSKYDLTHAAHFFKHLGYKFVRGLIGKGIKFGTLGTLALKTGVVGLITSGLSSLAGAGGTVGAIGGGLMVGATGLGVGLVLYELASVLKDISRTMMLNFGRFAGRNAVTLVPLWYRGLPYIAGLEGYRLDTVECMMLDRYHDQPITRLFVGIDPWSVWMNGGEPNYLDLVLRGTLGSLYSSLTKIGTSPKRGGK